MLAIAHNVGFGRAGVPKKSPSLDSRRDGNFFPLNIVPEVRPLGPTSPRRCSAPLQTHPMGRSCPHLAFGIQVADSLPPAHTTTTLLTAAAGRVCSSPGPQERVCPGVSNSAMTLMPRSRAYSITVCTSLAVYTWVIALKAPWGNTGNLRALLRCRGRGLLALGCALHGNWGGLPAC